MRSGVITDGTKTTRRIVRGSRAGQNTYAHTFPIALVWSVGMRRDSPIPAWRERRSHADVRIHRNRHPPEPAAETCAGFAHTAQSPYDHMVGSRARPNRPGRLHWATLRSRHPTIAMFCRPARSANHLVPPIIMVRRLSCVDSVRILRHGAVHRPQWPVCCHVAAISCATRPARRA